MRFPSNSAGIDTTIRAENVTDIVTVTIANEARNAVLNGGSQRFVFFGDTQILAASHLVDVCEVSGTDSIHGAVPYVWVGVE
jgi:hypothetical protein